MAGADDESTELLVVVEGFEASNFRAENNVKHRNQEFRMVVLAPTHLEYTGWWF